MQDVTARIGDQAGREYGLKVVDVRLRRLNYPEEVRSAEFAARLLEHGIVVAPGVFLGPTGEGYVRFALVPTIDDCRRAAAILKEVL